MAKANRKQRRATQKRSPQSSIVLRDLPAPLSGQLNALAVLGGFANHVSITQAGLPTTTNGRLASMVFAKCCAHARSISAIALQSSMFDHHAIMALSRMIVEASTMLCYLLEPVSEDEQSFRYTVLKLHDTVARIKLLRGFSQPTDDLKLGRAELTNDLITSPCFLRYPEERRKRLVSGEEMFVRGMRSIATRTVGWDEEQFAGVYAYFSAHTHSAPMSFMRMGHHHVDYFFPSKEQIDILVLSLEVSIACVRRSMIRMIDCQPEQIDEYNVQLLSEAREADSTCPFFSSD